MSETYIHIKTRLRAVANASHTAVSNMFRFHVTGHSYQNNKIIDTYFIGYVYATSGTLSISNSTLGTAETVGGFCYMSSDGYLTLRLDTGSYYTTGTVNTLKVGNGGAYTPDDILDITFNRLLEI